MANGYIPGQAFQLAQAGVTGKGMSQGEAFQRAIMMAELSQRRQMQGFQMRLSEKEYELAAGRLAIDNPTPGVV